MEAVQEYKVEKDGEIVKLLEETPLMVTECIRCKELENIFLGRGVHSKKKRQKQSLSGWKLFRLEYFKNTKDRKNASDMMKDAAKLWKDPQIKEKYNTKANEIKEEQEKLYFRNLKLQKEKE